MKILNNLGTNPYKIKFLKSLDKILRKPIERKSAYNIDNTVCLDNLT